MDSKKDAKRQQKREDDSLLYVIRRAVQDEGMGTWADTRAVYNHLATKKKSLDSVKSHYRLLTKDKMAWRTVERAMRDPKWAEKEREVKKLLRLGVPHVRRTCLCEKPS
jgi:hypothetical protein